VPGAPHGLARGIGAVELDQHAAPMRAEAQRVEDAVHRRSERRDPRQEA
jgi:hypothetical protein